MNVEVVKAPGGVRADNGQSHQSIERAALDVRRLIASDVPMDEALPGWKLFDKLNQYSVLGGQVRLEPAVEDLPAGIEGWTRYDAKRNRIIVALSADTYDEFELDNRRARFSFAHEVGHAVLHCRELVRTGAIAHQMAALRRGMTLPHKKFMDTEWQANVFASALLMPAAGLRLLERKVGPFPLESTLVSSTFKVSRRAAVYRLDNFNSRRVQLLHA